MEPISPWTLISVAHYLVAVFFVERILRMRRDPGGMLAWILALLLLPVLGPLLYLLVGYTPIQRKVRRRRRRRRLIEPALSRQTAAVTAAYDARREPVLSERQRDLMQMALRLTGAAVTRGNEVDLYHDAERAFLNLGLAIQAAQSYIHLEYYIFADDETGRGVRDLLVGKAREGVRVRLLADAVGSWRMRRAFVRSLEQAGVQVAFFLPWGLTRRRFRLNCRNHRKLTVVDGRTGFLGSKNIGDEYLGRRRQRLGPWRDTHLRVRGPCVAQLQEVFLEDWHFATGEALAPDAYLPPPIIEGNHLVQMVPSGPDQRPDVLYQLLYAAVADARHSVALLTPYFVPDEAMMLALTSAACRGVRVQVLLPSRSDHWLLLWAARSVYRELMETGVEIYEYPGGMLHSKEVIVDGRWAMVGSANMDVRSFAINFELTSLLYDETLARQLQGEFQTLRREAIRITARHIRERTYAQTLAAGLGRLATPML